MPGCEIPGEPGERIPTVRVLQRIQALPGVKAAGLTLSLPLGGSNYQ